MITVDLYDRTKTLTSTLLQFDVQEFDADAIGGPATAAITVSGDGVSQVRQWLGYYVILRNGSGVPVWWGRIVSATVDINGIRVDISLNDVYNRIAVLYTVLDGDGYAVSRQTTWVESARSIAAYGKHELKYSLGEASTDQAEKAAARLLADLAWPKQSISLGSGNSASIRCEGLWRSLDQTYLVRNVAKETYLAIDNAEQHLGWGVTSTVTGFSSGAYNDGTGTKYDAGRRAIHRLAGGLDMFLPGERIVVAGSASNNGVKTVASQAGGEVKTYTATTISFDPGDDINDSAGGLGFVDLGAFIRVTGSAANNGWHLIDETGANHIATDTGVTAAITTGTAGPSVSIEHGQMLPINEAATMEVPGGAVTLTGYTALHYSFALAAGGYKASEIWVKLKKIGSPADNITISLHSNFAGVPFTTLDSLSIPGSMLSERMSWVQFVMPAGVTLATGTTYWIGITRSGSNSTNYYVVGLNELLAGETADHSGTIKLTSNNTLVNRPVTATMPFQIWGYTDTGAQMLDILTNDGQYLSGVSVRVTTGVPRRTYRDGSADLLVELNNLLDAGTSAGEKLLATVTPDWHCIIDKAPTGDAAYVLRPGPVFETASGAPLDEGVLPVGQMVGIDDAGEVNSLAPISPFILGYASWSSRRGITQIRAIGASNALDFARIAQG